MAPVSISEAGPSQRPPPVVTKASRNCWNATFEVKVEVLDWWRAHYSSGTETLKHFVGRFPRLSKQLISRWTLNEKHIRSLHEDQRQLMEKVNGDSAKGKKRSTGSKKGIPLSGFRARKDGSPDLRGGSSPSLGPLHSLRWHRVVLDEAHSIKAFQCRQARSVFALTADRHWALTGTPIQNALTDIFSLLHFLRVEPWANYGWWNKLIQRPYDSGDTRSLKLLQSILRPLMLRRTKDSKDREGRPILELPAADVDIIKCQQTPEEKDFYEALHAKSKVKFNSFVEEGKVLNNYVIILELLLRMRQCCDHPYLVMSRSDTSEYADLDKLAKRFSSGPSGRHIDTDTQPAGILVPAEREGGEGPSEEFVKRVVEDLRNGVQKECLICLEPMEDAVFTPCAHQFCRECLLSSWKLKSKGDCPLCRRHMTKGELITAPRANRFNCDVEANWQDSCKVQKLFECLEQLRPTGEKCVVFSQFTSFLDLLQIPLMRKKFPFVRLDGTMSQVKRTKAIEEFKTRPDVQVMLISLKAGGVGLNLTAASTCFLLDPWWNPAVEEQAIMRIHRIGQKRPVTVRRFIVEGTVEEKMQNVQARKQRMVNGALTDDEAKSARIEELKELFR
eukprot:TRINITY_DN937_c0_g1_i1.p1 TRINITY_DN937_c0_g1~~TRINITY_DN937_c0_g1_i1.p1  ORF type:complete len:617 (-),score=143.17 TRINITY_DN937_c0_g1_i1:1130-2980(-)